jgi:hypothetical protein
MAHILTVYQDDDTTPLFAVGTDPSHPYPYLHEPGEFAPAEVDLQAGRAHIGWGSFRVIDPQTGATKQHRHLTALLGAASGHSALIRRRLVHTEAGVVRMDGIVAGVRLSESFAGYEIDAADVRDRGIDLPVFTRTDTCTVLPRGIREGWGKLWDAQGILPAAWMVSPTAPLRARFEAATTASYSWATFFLAGAPTDPKKPVPPELAYTDAMATAAQPDTATTSGDRYEHGAHRRLALWWRPASGGSWRILRNLPAHTSGLLGVTTGKLNGEDAQAVASLRFRLDGTLGPVGGDNLPAQMQMVDVMLCYEGPPTEQYPLHIEAPFGQFAIDIMSGAYSHRPDGSTINPRLRYNAAAWLADTTPVRARIVKSAGDVREVLEQICKARGCAPGLNAAGEIVPVYDRLPAQDETLPQIDDTNCTAVAGWEHPSSRAVTAVEVTYPRFFRVPAERDPGGTRSGGDGLAERKVTVRHQAHPSVTAVMGEQDVLEIDGWIFGAMGGIDGSPLSGDVTREQGAQASQQRARLSLDRFSYGAQSGYCRVMAVDFPTLKLGDWLIDARSWVPNYLTGLRQGNALAQVVSIARPNPAWIDLRIEYAGPGDMPLGLPTFGTPTVGADGVVSVPVSTIPTITGGPAANAVVEYAIAETQPLANSGAWTLLGVTDTPADVLKSPALPAGATIWLRGRASAPGVRPSAWVNIGSVSLPQTARLLGLSVTIASDGAPVVEATGNAFTLGVRLRYAIHEAGEAPDDWTQVDRALSAMPVTLDVVVPPGSEITVEATPYPGWTGSAVSGTAGDPLRVRAIREVTAAYVEYYFARRVAAGVEITARGDATTAELHLFARATAADPWPTAADATIEAREGTFAALPMDGAELLYRIVPVDADGAPGVAVEDVYREADSVPAISVTFSGSNEAIVTVSGLPFDVEHFIAVASNSDPDPPTPSAYDAILEAKSGTVASGVFIAQGAVAHVAVVSRRAGGALSDVVRVRARNIAGGTITASIAFNSANEAVVTANGPAGTAKLYITAAENTAPADPTPSVHDAQIVGASGTANTGVVVAEGSIAFVRIVAEDGASNLSEIVAFSAVNAAAKVSPVAYVRITAMTDTTATVEYSGSTGVEGRSVATEYRRRIDQNDRLGVVTTGTPSAWSATLPNTEIIQRRAGRVQTVFAWVRDAEGRESSAASVAVPAADDAVLALNQWHEEQDAETVRWRWEPGPAVHEVWVYWIEYPEGAVPENPWPAGRAPNLFLPASTKFLERPKPTEGRVLYIQFEGRDNDTIPRSGPVRRATVQGLAPSIPTVHHIGQAPATTPSPTTTNVTAVVGDRQNRTLRVHAWVNRGSTAEPNPQGTPDAYIDVTPSGGAVALNESHVWTLTAGGTANLFRNLTVHAQHGKRIFLRAQLLDGSVVGPQAEGLLHSWYELIGATGDWTPNIVTTTAIADAAIAEGKLAANAVTTAKLAELAVTAEKVAASAVTTAKIADAAVATAKLADGAATEAKVAANAITATKITDGAISTPKLAAGAVTAAKITAGTITSTEIASATIVAGNIASGAITTAKLDALAVTAVKIAADAVTADKILAGAVTAVKIVSGAITTDKLAANAVTAATIASGAVTTAKLDALAVSADKIAANAITTDKIAALAVTAVKINVAQLSEIKQNMGIMVTGVLHNGTAGIRIAASDNGPSFYGWTNYLDLAATGTGSVIKTPHINFRANGSAALGNHFTVDTSGNVVFSGALSAATGSFVGSVAAGALITGSISMTGSGEIVAGVLRNSTNSVGVNLNATGSTAAFYAGNGLVAIQAGGGFTFGNTGGNHISYSTGTGVLSVHGHIVATSGSFSGTVTSGATIAASNFTSVTANFNGVGCSALSASVEVSTPNLVVNTNANIVQAHISALYITGQRVKSTTIDGFLVLYVDAPI